MPPETKKSRQEQRRQRYLNASAMVRELGKSYRGHVLDRLRFADSWTPGMTDAEIRDQLKQFVDYALELQDAAEAFVTFCDC